MRKFTIKIFILLIPVLLLFFSMELGLRNLPSDYKLKKEYLDANSNQIETLILGSSHAYFGLDPQYFSSKTFNASYLSQTLDYDYMIFNKYQSDFKSLKTIVISISYFTLFARLESAAESWRKKDYEIYYDMNMYENIFKYADLFKYKFNVSVHKLNNYYIKKKSPISSTDLGWGTIYKSEEALDLIETGKIAALIHSGDGNLEAVQNIYIENLALLNFIIEWCEYNDVRLILITLPGYETYRKNLNIQQLDTMIKTVSALDSISSNCRYLNFIEDSRFIANDFYDADHLSEIGAKKLSKIISSIIENY